MAETLWSCRVRDAVLSATFIPSCSPSPLANACGKSFPRTTTSTANCAPLGLKRCFNFPVANGGDGCREPARRRFRADGFGDCRRHEFALLSRPPCWRARTAQQGKQSVLDEGGDRAQRRRRLLESVDRFLRDGNEDAALRAVRGGGADGEDRWEDGTPLLLGFGRVQQVPKRIYGVEELRLNKIEPARFLAPKDSTLGTIRNLLQVFLGLGLSAAWWGGGWDLGQLLLAVVILLTIGTSDQLCLSLQ